MQGLISSGSPTRRTRRSRTLSLLLAGTAVAAVTTAGGAATGSAVAADVVTTAGATGPTGGPTLALIPSSSPTTLTQTALATSGQRFGARGWIRATQGSGGVAMVSARDAAGDVADSAPLHLKALWQSFGVTLPAAAAGAATVTLEPATTAGWPAGMQVEVAGVDAGSTLPSVTKRDTAISYAITLDRNDGQGAQLFNPRGFLYWPFPIGHAGFTDWADPTTCQQDARLLAGMGVTMIQSPVYEDVFTTPAPNPTVSVPPTPPLPNVSACADAFWGAGIGVAWLVDGPPEQPVAQGAEYEAAAEAGLKQAMSVLADHPATYLWLVGNEVDADATNRNCFFDNPYGGTCADHDLAHQVALVHATDPNHLVGTKVVGCSGAMTASDVPALDFWGVDDYPQLNFDNIWSCLHPGGDSRPVYIAEFGNARYDCAGLDPLYSIGYGGVEPVSPPTTTIDLACPQGSGEDQAGQATANGSLWTDLINHEVSAASTTNPVIGGSEFTWSDMWWYSETFCCDFSDGTPATHDVEAYTGIDSYPSGWWSPEWTGASNAQLPEATSMERVTASVVTSIEQDFGIAPPLVSGVSAHLENNSSAGCTLDVSWTTSTPSTSTLDWGGHGAATLPDGNSNDPLNDNTYYDSHYENDTMVTSHSIRITSGFEPFETYRAVVRSFDANGHYDVSQPFLVQFPVGTCE